VPKPRNRFKTVSTVCCTLVSKTVKTVQGSGQQASTGLKPGENEKRNFAAGSVSSLRDLSLRAEF
jgi:hypothetical protein